MVAERSFRGDLGFRLRVIQIELPPLRERLADLPGLAEHFLGVAAERHGKSARSLAPETLDLLLRYGWPGNVRELKNATESMVLLTRGRLVPPEAVPAYIRPADEGPEFLGRLSSVPLRDVERALIENTLRDMGGNRERASQMLGISTRTLYRKIKEYGHSRPDDPAEDADSAR
jgi:two-component system response regulator HydG